MHARTGPVTLLPIPEGGAVPTLDTPRYMGLGRQQSPPLLHDPPLLQHPPSKSKLLQDKVPDYTDP